jgi:hypothetical protein
MRLIQLSALLFLAACSVTVVREGETPGTESQSAAEATDEARVVQALIDAFNRRDVDAYMANHAPAVVYYEFPADTVFSGAARIRAHYTELFADPDAKGMHVDVRERIVKGRFVTQQEFYRGLPGEDTHVSVVIYEVSGGRIQNAWFMN